MVHFQCLVSGCKGAEHVLLEPIFVISHLCMANFVAAVGACSTNGNLRGVFPKLKDQFNGLIYSALALEG